MKVILYSVDFTAIGMKRRRFVLALIEIKRPQGTA